MDLAEFHTMVDSLAGEAGSVDAHIPAVVRHARLWLERNYNFEYMRRITLVNFPINADPPPNNIGKFIKGFGDGEVRKTGSIEGIQKIKFTKTQFVMLDDEEFNEKYPVWYFKDATGATFIKPLVAITEPLTLVFDLFQMTDDWPSTTFTGYEHPLIDMAEDVLLAQSMLNLAAVTRDPELQQFYEAKFQTGLKTLIDAEFIFTYED